MRRRTKRVAVVGGVVGLAAVLGFLLFRGRVKAKAPPRGMVDLSAEAEPVGGDPGVRVATTDGRVLTF